MLEDFNKQLSQKCSKMAIFEEQINYFNFFLVIEI